MLIPLCQLSAAGCEVFFISAEGVWIWIERPHSVISVLSYVQIKFEMSGISWRKECSIVRESVNNSGSHFFSLGVF